MLRGSSVYVDNGFVTLAEPRVRFSIKFSALPRVAFRGFRGVPAGTDRVELEGKVWLNDADIGVFAQ